MFAVESGLTRDPDKFLEWFVFFTQKLRDFSPHQNWSKNEKDTRVLVECLLVHFGFC